MHWPSISSRVVPWSSQPEGIATTSRRARRGIPTTYRPAVVPEIATVPVELPGDVAADLDDATRLLTAFDAGGAGEVAPFASILLRSESAASSHIENLTSSARALAEAAIGAGDRTNAVAILANVRTMQAAMDLAGDLDVASVLSMHRALMTGQQRVGPGRWREEQVWIGGSGLHPGDAEFVPPVAAEVPPLMDDLVAFLDRDDVPPWPWGHSPTPSSRRSIPSRTATAGPAGPCSMRHCSTRGSSTGSPSRSRPASSWPRTGTSRRSAPTEPAMPSRSFGASRMPPVQASRWARDSSTGCARCGTSGADASRRARTPPCGPSPTCCCVSRSSPRSSSWQTSTCRRPPRRRRSPVSWAPASSWSRPGGSGTASTGHLRSLTPWTGTQRASVVAAGDSGRLRRRWDVRTPSPAAAVEAHHDLVVVRLREHVEEPSLEHAE